MEKDLSPIRFEFATANVETNLTRSNLRDELVRVPFDDYGELFAT